MAAGLPSAGSTGPIVINISVAFGVLTILVLATRLFARIVVVKAVGPDDILITIASFLSWAFITVTILSVQHGLGSHIETVPLTEFLPYLRIVWFSSIFYNACLGFIKISVLALYMRLGDVQLRKRAIIMTVVVACQAGANVLTCIFQCAPVRAAWDLSILAADKKCVDINAFYIANAACNIATDVMTYVLPIGLIRHLQMPMKQKIGLGIMLGLGMFACLSSIIRITFVPRLLASKDATYDISPAMYWSVIETNIGILAASIPSFKSVFKRYLPHLIGDYSSKSGTKGNGLDTKGRTTTNTDTSRSGFVELEEGGARKGGSRNRSESKGEMELGAMYKSGKAGNVNTNITSGKYGSSFATTPNSSEEMIIPHGQILAQTSISHQFSGQEK